jgi:heat shock protein HspQ
MSGEEKPEGCRFGIGEVVRHRRYGYRGVIFGYDPECTADEAWYQANQTQPPRDQPWYHVMVDSGTHTTYVAESNLETDTTGLPVRHPMVGRVFEGFAEGRYWRRSPN